MSLSIILPILLLGSAVVFADDLTCRDENGKAVDWYIVYKLPRQPSQPAPLNTGFAYAYLTGKAIGGHGNQKEKTNAFTLSKFLVKDEQSIFGKTLAPLYAKPNDYSYVMYNDAPPEEDGKESSYWAHAKGVFALNKKSGFWLIHSVPKFARAPTTKYEYPDTGMDNGQTALCISIKTDKEGKDMVNQLKHLTPNIYTNHETDEVLKMLPEFKDLGEKKYKTGKEESVGEITSSSGAKNFISFARSKVAAAAGDLYSLMVAPNLKTDLFVETWRRGAGSPLESNCKDKFQVSNINEMMINFSKESPLKDSGVWPYARDHSKWAMSQDEKNPFVCIGDINRMKSQFKRGGGTVCVNDKNIWKVFKDAVHEIEACNLRG